MIETSLFVQRFLNRHYPHTFDILRPTINHHFRQLALQGAAALVTLSLAWPYFTLRSESLPWAEVTVAIGITALAVSTLTREPWWWRAIHALFAPLAWGTSTLSIAPGWFFLALVATLLVYRGAITGRIPLYLSNTPTTEALVDLTCDIRNMRFVDLGAGTGTVVFRLSKALPDAKALGIENAPATWLVGFLRTRKLPNCTWVWGDLWRTDLSKVNVAYAFLSPAPMAGLWLKIKEEMPHGSLFISNSFPVPEIEPSQIIAIDDAQQTLLYLYQL